MDIGFSFDWIFIVMSLGCVFFLLQILLDYNRNREQIRQELQQIEEIRSRHDEEIKKVVEVCPVCRTWQQPPIPPKVRTDLPQKFNDEVDFDFMFYRGQPIGVFVDHAIRISVVHATVSFPGSYRIANSAF